MAWRVGEKARYDAFANGSRLTKIGKLYRGYLVLLRYVVPIAVVTVFIHGLL